MVTMFRKNIDDNMDGNLNAVNSTQSDKNALVAAHAIAKASNGFIFNSILFNSILFNSSLKNMSVAKLIILFIFLIGPKRHFKVELTMSMIHILMIPP